MNHEERYLFDLMGYLVIEQVLSRAEVEELNAAIDKRNVWAEGAAKTEGPHNNGLKMHIGPLVDWGDLFVRLIEHPVVLSYLRELIGDKMRLDHEYAIFMKAGGAENPMHGGGTPYDPAQYYHYRNERFYNGLTVVTFALADVNEEEGGFCCIPGSHKSNVSIPPAFRRADQRVPWMVQPTMRAGDVLIFTEALTHGTRPWIAAHERRALLYKFSPGHQAWGRNYRTAKETMDETARLLMEPPYVANRQVVVKNEAPPVEAGR